MDRRLLTELRQAVILPYLRRVPWRERNWRYWFGRVYLEWCAFRRKFR